MISLATPEEIRDAHKAQTLKVLRMLQEGPQTTQAFLQAYIGRFGARIGELRAVGWTIRMTKLGEHGAAYVLIGERNPSRGDCGKEGCEVCR